MKRNRFYKTSPHGGVGSNVCFHGVKGNGYVTNLDDAHIYTREEAQNEVDKDWMRDYPEQELFLSADHVDELSVWKVDSQYVERHYPEHTDPNDEYVSYATGLWDGNDLAFGDGIGWNYDYAKAKTFSKEDIDPYVKEQNLAMRFVPRSHADQLARRTFQKVNINRRKMISSAGIVGIRTKRERQSSGKTRWNCPECGKIVWQHNPYEFMSCSDIECSAYDGYLAACG
ncbi:hypothetical protein R7Y21_14300 [Vibrio sp. 945]|nr:hypothetical protein [Vibrio parahaemolyticus]MDW1971046.1 hypothetical protein [Vibrio sp. 945]